MYIFRNNQKEVSIWKKPVPFAGAVLLMLFLAGSLSWYALGFSNKMVFDFKQPEINLPARVNLLSSVENIFPGEKNVYNGFIKSIYGRYIPKMSSCYIDNNVFYLFLIIKCIRCCGFLYRFPVVSFRRQGYWWQITIAFTLLLSTPQAVVACR